MKGAISVKKNFGILPSGEAASLYTISCGGITAGITDYGATLVSLLVPGSSGSVSDVVPVSYTHLTLPTTIGV